MAESGEWWSGSGWGVRNVYSAEVKRKMKRKGVAIQNPTVQSYQTARSNVAFLKLFADGYSGRSMNLISHLYLECVDL